eukprot:402983_1
MPRRNKKRARSGPFRSAQVSTQYFRDTIQSKFEGGDPNPDIWAVQIDALLPSLAGANNHSSSGNRNFCIEKFIVEAIPQFPTATNFDTSASVQYIPPLIPAGMPPGTPEITYIADAPFKMLNSTIPTQLGFNVRAMSKKIPALLAPMRFGSTPDNILRIVFSPPVPAGASISLRITTVVSLLPQTNPNFVP